MPLDVQFTVWALVAFVALFFAVGTIVAVEPWSRPHGERLRAEGGGGALDLRER